MRAIRFDGSFAGWRDQARQLLLEGIEPQAVDWTPGLFDGDDTAPSPAGAASVSIPRELPALLADAARFRAHDRWALLYQVLWRVAQGDRSAMLAGDRDGSELQRRIKAVRREAHHMHAFLRFRPGDKGQGAPDYLAWHEPAHDVLDLGAEHFVPRMGRHSWLIGTPEGLAHFDGEHLAYQSPCPPGLREAIEGQDDPSESLWTAYYRSTFNPSRLNPEVMRSHMPARFWKHLAEGALIPELVADARTGRQRLAQAPEVGARQGKEVLIASDAAQPERAPDTRLDQCRRCHIWRNATCAVPGEGPAQARIMLVGEQPGDQEDLAGRPFLGPAGQVLQRALAEAGLSRQAVYLTNAVKHFKWEPRGGALGRAATRWHATPKPAEIRACHPWLARELEEHQPQWVVALGRTALASLLGLHDPQRIRLADYLGKPLRHEGRWISVAPHPAAVLRNRDGGEQLYRELVDALRQAQQGEGAVSGSDGPGLPRTLPATGHRSCS